MAELLHNKFTPHAGIITKVGTGVTINYAADTNSQPSMPPKSSDVAHCFRGNHPTCAAGVREFARTPVRAGRNRQETQITLSAAQETMIELVHAAKSQNHSGTHQQFSRTQLPGKKTAFPRSST